MKKVKITPVPKPRMTKSDRWKKRPCVVKYWDFKEELLYLFREQDIVVDKELYIEFHLPMAKSWSKKKKKKMNGDFHNQKPDIDNLIKAVLDALMAEDCRVHTVFARKFWAEEGGIVILDSQEF